MAVSINTGGTYKVTRPTNADADAATGWAAETLEGSGGAAGLLASVGTIDLVAEGTDARATRVNKQRVLIFFTYATGFDFTSGSTGTGGTKVPDGNAYIWAAFLAAGSAFLKANGGGQICLGDGTNRSFWNVFGSDTYSGGFQKWAINTGITRSENDGADVDLGDVTEIGFVCDVGGTTTRFDNMVVDAFDIGDGLTIQGTTAGDALFAESVTQDELTAIGVLKSDNGIIFAQGNVEFSGTAQTSIGETLVFTDTLGGAYTYQFDVTGTVTLTNSIVNGSGLVDFNFDTSGATAFIMTGGSLGGFNALVTAAGQTMSGIVFQSGGASTVANTISDSPFNQCGKITVTGVLDSCTINKSSGSVAVSAADTAKALNCNFIKDTAASHAFELTGAAGSYSWSGITSGYDVGSTGNGVEVTGGSITGDEDIHITATTGTFIINVESGATTPSVSSAGAVVNVVAGLVSLTISAQVSLVGAEIAIYDMNVTPPDFGDELAHSESHGSATFIYSGSASNLIRIQVMLPNYEEFSENFTMPTVSGDKVIKLEVETN